MVGGGFILNIISSLVILLLWWRKLEANGRRIRSGGIICRDEFIVYVMYIE